MESEEDFSSDSSDELNSPSESKRPRNSIYTSSEEEEEETTSDDSSTSSSSSESEDEEDSNEINDAIWSDPIGNQPGLVTFTGNSGSKAVGDDCQKVEDFYQLFVTEEMFQKIAENTNSYAARILSRKQSKRLEKWTPTDKNEIKQFFGLIMWMGLVQVPNIHLYWSKKPAYEQIFARNVMSRNRFELLLRVLHFTHNEEASSGDHLQKIKEVVDALNENFQKYYDPGEMLYVDESLAAFYFAAFAQQKIHKHGATIFRLLSAPGYTNTFQIFHGKKSGRLSNRADVILSLCKNILGKGHTVCTDNRTTSIDLAKQLIASNTHLVGAIRSYRGAGLSKEVLSKRLKPGEMIAKEQKDGLTLLKWKDRYSILLLSSKHSTEKVTVRKRGRNCIRPKAIVDFNQAHSFTKTLDEMAENINPLRRSVKWYKKIILELLLSTSVVNAWILYKTKHNPLSVIKFTEQLILYLTRCKDQASGEDSLSPATSTMEEKRHEMHKKEGKQSSIRRRCTLCYMKNVQKFGTQLARNSTVKVVTYCNDCPGKPHLCLSCFNIKHR